MNRHLSNRALVPVLLLLGALGPRAQAAQPDDWAIVASPNSPTIPTDNVASGVTCVSATDCWLVGSYRNGGTDQTLIEHWDGSAWSVTPSPNTSPTQRNVLRRVACVASSDCWAVGTFTDITTDHTLIQHWDGSAWTIVASPNAGVDQANMLSSIACSSATSCVAVGSALTGGNYQTLILRWDGTTWSIIASPNTSASQSNFLSGVACASANDCWAVGSATSRTAEQTLIMRWNGAAWSIVTSPNTGAGHNILYGVTCTSAADCWSVGSYVAGSLQQTLIMRWNGTVWSAALSPNAGSPTPQSNVLIGISCAGASACIAVGRTESSAGAPTALIERWDGSSWSIATTPSIDGDDQLIGATCSSSTLCWSVGSVLDGELTQTLIQRWDGSGWSVAPSANAETETHNTLLGVTCVTAADCWSVASSNNGVAQQTLIQRWNGITWSIVPSPNTSSTSSNILYDVACVSASDCWAVGYAAGVSAFQTLTMHWNGASWTIVSSPSTAAVQNNFLNDVTCVSATECWAVGFYDPGSPYQTLVERWDGSSWTILASPNTDLGQDNRLYGVTCATAGECWAVGRHTLPSGFTQNLIERWDGSAWTIADAANTSDTQGNYLWSIACATATECWAVGSFSEGFGTARSLITRWDGTSWTIVESPDASSNYVFLKGVTCATATACWAVGYVFVDGHHRTLVERWDGAAWTISASPNSHATQNNFLIGVSCPSPSECWASGYHYDDSGIFRTLTVRYGASEPPNTAPIAALRAAPSSGVAPLTVTLDAGASRDPDPGDAVISYRFEFGDGSAAATGTDPSVSHVYTALGTYLASVTVTDARGATSTNIASNTIQVTPSDARISTPLPDALLSVSPVTISGSTDPNLSVHLREAGTDLATTSSDPSGAFSFTYPFGDGAHTVSAIATDAAGGLAAVSAERTFTVDTTAPAAPSVATPASTMSLGDAFVRFSGAAEARSIVRLRVDGQPIAVATAAPTGEWSAARGLRNGEHTLTVTSTDAAGHTSVASPVRRFTVADRTPPPAPIIDTPTASSTTGTLVVVTGSGEPGARVTLREGSSTLGITPISDAGDWHLVLAEVATGDHAYIATATDPASNTGADSPVRAFTVRVDQGPQLTITGPGEDSVQPGRITISGTGARPNASVTVADRQLVLGTVTAAGDGTWSMAAQLPSGIHQLVATGAAHTPSAVRAFTVDAQAPIVTVTTPQRTLFAPGATALIEGEASDDRSILGVTVTYLDAANREVATGLADCTCGVGVRSARWTSTPNLPMGYYRAVARTIDQAGNVSLTSSTTFLRL